MKKKEINRRLDKLEQKIKYLKFKEKYGDGYRLTTVANVLTRNNVSVEYAGYWEIIKLQTDREANHESVYPSIQKTDDFTFLILKTKIQMISEGVEYYVINRSNKTLTEVNEKFFKNAGGKI